MANLTHATPTGTVEYFQEGLVKEMDYAYDALHRLTTATHVTDGSALEVFTYDLLGNRSHYDTTDQTAGVFYAHNAANEYTLVDTVDPPVNTYTHDAAGNLTWDHPAFSTTTGYNYVYDFENRLVEVKRLPTQFAPEYVTIAKYTYDALGRRIREQHWDTQALPIVGMDWTFYYDGQNVVAVYDNADMPPSENLTTYFVHGLHRDSSPGAWCIDERAVMHEVCQRDYSIRLHKLLPNPLVRGLRITDLASAR